MDTKNGGSNLVTLQSHMLQEHASELMTVLRDGADDAGNAARGCWADDSQKALPGARIIKDQVDALAAFGIMVRNIAAEPLLSRILDHMAPPPIGQDWGADVTHEFDFKPEHEGLIEWGGTDGLTVKNILHPDKAPRSTKGARLRSGMRHIGTATLQANGQAKGSQPKAMDDADARMCEHGFRLTMTEPKGSAPGARTDGVLGHGHADRTRFSSLGPLATRMRAIITNAERQYPKDADLRQHLTTPQAWANMANVQLSKHKFTNSQREQLAKLKRELAAAEQCEHNGRPTEQSYVTTNDSAPTHLDMVNTLRARIAPLQALQDEDSRLQHATVTAAQAAYAAHDSDWAQKYHAFVYDAAQDGPPQGDNGHPTPDQYQLAPAPPVSRAPPTTGRHAPVAAKMAPPEGRAALAPGGRGGRLRRQRCRRSTSGVRRQHVPIACQLPRRTPRQRRTGQLGRSHNPPGSPSLLPAPPAGRSR